MKSLLLIAALLFSSSIQTATCQSNDFRKQRIQFAAFNVGFNGLVGGIGRLINKSDEVTGFQAFKKGFYQGALGGSISHVGLSMTHHIYTQRNIALAWPSRMVNAFGSSIIQNTAEGRRMLERMHFNLYMTRLEYYPYQKKFTGRLFTSSIYGIAVTGKNARFNMKKSLQTGILYFESDEDFTISSTGIQGRATGQVSSVGMRSDLTTDDYYAVFAHEMAHILQFDRKVGGNALLFKPHQKLTQQSNFYRTLSKYIYFDLNGPLFWLGYKLEGTVHNCNFFEQEAVVYSERRAHVCPFH